jgi:phosphoribosyl 1,2-cyclic phosphate phosphodiesterase
VKVTVLGCGTSSGVPRIGNDWGLCDPAEPKNRRRRVSVLVEADGHVILIDTSPDLREQLLDANVTRLDAVLYSHDHADHSHGLDDLRQVFHLMKRQIDCYATPGTWAVLKTRFGYAFEGGQGYPPSCSAHVLPPRLAVGPMTVTPFEQIHGPIRSTGFRIDHNGRSMAYSTDISDLTLSADNAVKGVDLWIVDALRRKPHPTHTHLDRTLSWISKLRPRRAILTHMDNTMDYATLARTLPAGVEPGYDMLTVEL